MDFTKFSGSTHTTKAKFKDEEFSIKFRGSTSKVYRELEQIDGYLDREAGTVKLPEYLSVFVVSLISGSNTFKPDLAYWEDAELDFVQTVYGAISEANLATDNAKKSTAASSGDTLSEATSAA